MKPNIIQVLDTESWGDWLKEPVFSAYGCCKYHKCHFYLLLVIFFIVVALNDLQTTAPTLLRPRVGTAHISCLQRCGIIQSVGTNPGHGKAPHICGSRGHSTFSTSLGNNGLVHHLKSLISLISFLKIHYSIKNLRFDESYGVLINALWRLGNNSKCKSKATPCFHNLNISPFCNCFCFFLQNNQDILLGRMRARKECSSPAGG